MSRRNVIKKELSVLIFVSVCVSGLFFFPIPQEAQAVKSDFKASNTEHGDRAPVLPTIAALAPQGGLLYFVNTNSDTVVANACANGVAGCSLRGAIQAANSHPGADGIEISLPAGSVIALTQALPDLNEGVSISGPGANLVSVRGAGNFRIFNVATSNTVTFSGITISNGSVSGSIVSDGGGINTFVPGTVNIISCTISGNSTTGSNSRGGGIASTGTLNITNSTISGNTSVLSGGGIANSGGTVNITNSTISGNTVTGGDGAGINNAGTLNVTNSTITGNSASGGNGGNRGGGINNAIGTVTIKSSIIALNSAVTSGPDLNGNFVSAGFNLIGKRDGSTGFIQLATDQTGTIASPLDPKLNSQGLQFNGGPTRTRALLSNSPAIDKGTSAGLTGNLTTDQRGAGFARTLDYPAILNPAGSDGTDVGAFELRKSQFDFDGDGKTDISVFRPSSNLWHLLRSQLGYIGVAFGQSGDLLTPADFDGDGKTDVAVFRPSIGTWYRLNSSTGAFFFEQFGANQDIPVPADFDRDGKADLAVFRPSVSTFYWKGSNNGAVTGVQFGQAGDKPAIGDFDGDGRADISVYRPSNGGWYRLNSSNGSFSGTAFGISEDRPTPADYDGDSKTDISVYRPSTGAWYRLNSSDGSFTAVAFGTSGDKPVAADYDGDLKAEIAVFRPSIGYWYMLSSINGAFSVLQFGTSEDQPTPNAFVQ